MNYADKLEDAILNAISDDGEAILFSGGIDTTLIAVLAYKIRKLPLITVIFKETSPPDLKYSMLIAKHLGAEHHIKFFDINEAVSAAKEVIKILKVFDPVEIRNSISIYIGLRFCKNLGYKCVLTGDGGDELFAGYSFLYSKSREEVENWIKSVIRTWEFSSLKIGKYLKILVKQPFTNHNVINIALKIPISLKIARYRGRIYGKYILRKILEKYVPYAVAWRNKDPIEFGSGSTHLRNIFSKWVSEDEYDAFSKEVKLRDKEQAFYYKLFKSLGYVIRPAKNPLKACKYCGSEVENKFCRICGAYPAI